MDLETAIRIETAEADSHFRLMACPECGSDNVAYVQYSAGEDQEPWKVRCFDCGFTVDCQAASKHEAQVGWNRKCQQMQDKPCMGCPDRYPGCSDHCKKIRFRAWKHQQELQRAAKEQKREIDMYQVGEMMKNRRVR